MIVCEYTVFCIEEAIWNMQIEALKVSCPWAYCRMSRDSVSHLAKALGRTRIPSGDGGIEMQGAAHMLHIAPCDTMPPFTAELVNAAGEVIVRATIAA